MILYLSRMRRKSPGSTQCRRHMCCR